MSAEDEARSATARWRLLLADAAGLEAAARQARQESWKSRCPAIESGGWRCELDHHPEDPEGHYITTATVRQAT